MFPKFEYKLDENVKLNDMQIIFLKKIFLYKIFLYKKNHLKEIELLTRAQSKGSSWLNKEEKGWRVVTIHLLLAQGGLFWRIKMFLLVSLH